MLADVENTTERKRHVEVLDSIVEKPGYDSSNKSDTDADLKLDKHGLPLIPQPSRWMDDPLNWPPWLKWAVLIQVSFMAFLGPFNCAVVNPSLVLLAKAMKVDSVTAGYSTTTAIILGGLSSFIWTPLANVYGRRPIVLLSIAIAVGGSVGSALSPNFSVLVGTRAVLGFGIGAMMSIGTAVVNDIFFMHERGEKTGVYTIFVTNGAHVAFLGGGFLAQRYGWMWDYWLPGIITGITGLIAVVLLPETLFSRDPNFLANRTHERSYMSMLFNFKGNLIPGRRLHGTDFLHSFYMLKYPSVALPFWYYTWSWSFINIVPAISLATIYTKRYHMKSGPIGVCLGVSLTIGSLLGEMSAGKLSDYIMYKVAQRHGGVRKPEARLYLSIVGAFFMPVGLIIFGVCISKKTAYIPPLVGLAVGTFGLQMTSTCLYAYVSDCYKPQTPESGNLFNLSRGLSFNVGFWVLPFAAKAGFDWAWFTFAVILLVFFMPIVALMVRGEKWRGRLGTPSFHRYL